VKFNNTASKNEEIKVADHINLSSSGDEMGDMDEYADHID
jgi:hypothetical protein